MYFVTFHGISIGLKKILNTPLIPKTSCITPTCLAKAYLITPTNSLTFAKKLEIYGRNRISRISLINFTTVFDISLEKGNNLNNHFLEKMT